MIISIRENKIPSDGGTTVSADCVNPASTAALPVQTFNRLEL